MTRSSAVLAALVVGWSSLAAAQGARSSSGLAVIDAPAGAHLTVTLTDGQGPRALVFVGPAPHGFYALDLSSPSLPRGARSGLRELARERPGALLDVLEGHRSVATVDVRVSPEGVFAGTTRAGDVSAIVRLVDSDDLESVTMTTGRNRAALTAAGAVGFGLLCLRQPVVAAGCAAVGAGVGYFGNRQRREVLFPYHAIEPITPGTSSTVPAAPTTATPAVPVPPPPRPAPALDRAVTFTNTRLRLSSHQGWAKEEDGALVSDPVGRQLRFEYEGRTVMTIEYDDIRLLHCEATPAGSRKFHYHLAIHHATSTGDDAISVVRIPSDGDVPVILNTLERHTGITVARAMAAASFAGAAIKLAPSDRVALVSGTGVKLNGTVTALSSDALTIKADNGLVRTIAASDIGRLRLAYDAGHDGKVGFLSGAAWGFAFGALVSEAVCDSTCVPGAAVKSGAILGLAAGGIGAAIGAGVGRAAYGTNHFFDVYTPSPPRSTARLMPLLGPGTLGAMMVVRP